MTLDIRSECLDAALSAADGELDDAENRLLEALSTVRQNKSVRPEQ